MIGSSDVLSVDALVDAARAQSGLADFGPEWFFEPLTRLVDSINREARLSDAGRIMVHERFTAALVNRLRTIDAVRRNPEIREERADVAGIILGLPRTGSTMLHRLLATAPGLTALRWWEALSYAPPPGELRGRPDTRVRAAETLLAAMLERNPDLLSIHPFQVHGADEEILILYQFFVGTMPEAEMYVPSFSAWLDGADQRAAYEDLRLVLQFLQWQDGTRRGRRWILKTPSHLSALDAVLAVFPDARLIMTHRDPLETIPSYCSMVAGLHRVTSDEVDAPEVGAFTQRRWASLLERFTALRDARPSHFVDVQYAALTENPIAVATDVLRALGEEVDAQTVQGLERWVAENGRERRAAHRYAASDYGLTRAALEAQFGAYRKRFIIDPTQSD